MKKLKLAGIVLALVGFAFVAGGGAVSWKAYEGLQSLQAVYRAQNIQMEYDEQGNFIDRGTVEDGNAILSLLTEDWQYPLNRRNLDPSDPLVNTPDELMVQHARISYHVMHGTQNIVLDEEVEYGGELFTAGTYEFPIEGRYWQDFDRMHPLEGPARGLAWTGTVHGLLANLAAGVASHTMAQFVLFMGIFIAGLGVVFLMVGTLLVMGSRLEPMRSLGAQ